MDTYFIRHTDKMKIEPSTFKGLWTKQRVGIHYPFFKKRLKRRDNTSLDPNDYVGGGRRAMRALRRLSEEGGYVCARYFDQNDILLGYVKPGTPIQLLKTHWSGEEFRKKGALAILKTIKLSKCRVLEPQDQPAIIASRPRLGTIMRWPRAKRMIENLVLRRKNRACWEDLTTERQEVVCSEFLRMNLANNLKLPRLKHLILPVGRTMQDIDIYGLTTKGRTLFAQVTSASMLENQTEEKLGRLKKFFVPNRTEAILFCDCEKPHKRDRIHIVPIRTVFRLLRQSREGRRLLLGV